MSSTEPAQSSPITLHHMPQQARIWQPTDDWTGVIDRKQRRKLQNRQNQRAYRRRRKGDEPEEIPSPSSAVMLVQSFSPMPILQALESEPIQNPLPKEEPSSDTLHCHHAPDHAPQTRRNLNAIVQHAYLNGSPRLEHLLSLSRLNVHRAINDNIRSLGMTPEWMASDTAISIFNLAQPTSPSATPTQIPPALLPTPIQLTIPHHPWLDFFPFPRMRDRLILAQDAMDDWDLCRDLMAFWDTRNTQATMLVWGAAWDPRNWEVTEGFARKWGWLLLGSPEALVASDAWRRRRGERGGRWGEILGTC